MALQIHSQMTSDPVATDLLFYVCPFEEFVSSRLFVCNPTGGAGTFRLYAVPADIEGVGAVNALYSDTAIAANVTTIVPPGVTLSRGDRLYIRGSIALVFTLFGEGVGDEG